MSDEQMNGWKDGWMDIQITIGHPHSGALIIFTFLKSEICKKKKKTPSKNMQAD